MKILAVEDDPVARAVLRQALRRLGHETVEAADGEAVWELLQNEPFRVVVSDWMMPKRDGLDPCRRIRGRVGTEYLYFILLTSRDATQENQTESADAGVDDFLTKPLDLTKLWTRLRVAERILRYTTQVRQLEEMLPICSYCKKNPRRPERLATTRRLHQRSHRQRFQPFRVPGLLQAGRHSRTRKVEDDQPDCDEVSLFR